jgi:hypothetical protein
VVVGKVRNDAFGHARLELGHLLALLVGDGLHRGTKNWVAERRRLVGAAGRLGRRRGGAQRRATTRRAAMPANLELLQVIFGRAALLSKAIRTANFLTHSTPRTIISLVTAASRGDVSGAAAGDEASSFVAPCCDRAGVERAAARGAAFFSPRAASHLNSTTVAT